MEIELIGDQTIWTESFRRFGSPSFLQSWPWGEFQAEQGHISLPLAVKNNRGEIVALSLTIKHRAKRGPFLFVPHGPIFSPQLTKNRQEKVLRALKDYLVKLGREEKFRFVRIGPLAEENEENHRLYENLGFHQAPIYLHSERCWLIDNLDKKDDQTLFQEMRKTTRYLIRKALKEKTLVLEVRDDEKAIDDFWTIYQKTFQRQHFSPFPKKFINDEFNAFHKKGQAAFVFTKDRENNQYLAGALIIFTRSSGFYHQGASLHSKLPASHLVQWGAIREAKRRGCSIYNFWGIYRPKRAPRAWQGLTLFKKGFGGRQIDYLPTQDYIIDPKRYWLTYLYERFLGWKRGIA